MATRRKILHDGWDGWQAIKETCAFVSADTGTSSAILNIPADVTNVYSPGMRFKYSQIQALTSYWDMNANSNSQVGSFNGTDTSITYTAGKFSNAATFNGTSSKIVIADNASLKPTGEFTLGMWFKKTGAGTQKMLFQSYSGNTNSAGIMLQITTNNILMLVIGKNVSSTDYLSISGITNVTDNAWHYVVISFRNNYAQMYVDGNLEVAGYMYPPVYAATNYVRIGCFNSAGTDSLFFDGQIDDLFLINGYALGEETIANQYALQAAQGTGSITINKKALISAVGAYSGGNTPITIWGGTDYSLLNVTISNPSFSMVARPLNFPIYPQKWTIEISDITPRLQSSPTINVWYNLGSINIIVPVGLWELFYETALQVTKLGGSSATICGTLSTSNSTESDIRNTSLQYVTADGSTGVTTVLSMFKKIFNKTKSKTTYYFNSRSIGTMDTIQYNNSVVPTIIRAKSTLL